MSDSIPYPIPRPESPQPIPSHAERVFAGKIFDVYQWEQTLFDGSKAIFEKVRRMDSVTVVPIMEDGKIILTEQEQPGSQPFFAAFGGRVERDEDPFAAAKRELIEEVGMEAREWHLWMATQLFQKIDWALYIFIAKGVKIVNTNRGDAGERIRLLYLTFDEFVDTLADPRYRDFEVSIPFFRAMRNPEEMQNMRKMFSV